MNRFTDKCPYCTGIPQLKSSFEVYGKDYGLIWLCPLCRAYVGCHRNSKSPKGFLANKEYRELRKQAHALFDPIWKNHEMSRNKAYARMADVLNIKTKDAHISQLSIEQLHKLIKSLELRRKNNE
jgi:hypothetical protein